MKLKNKKVFFLILISFFFYLFFPKFIHAGDCTNPRPTSPCKNDSDCLSGLSGNECFRIATYADGQYCECRPPGLVHPVQKEIELPGGYTIKFPEKFKGEFTDIGSIISALLPYIYYLAGLILFGAIIVSGFQFLFSTGDPKKTAEAKGCLTNAIIGFLIIFISYWLIQIIEVIFHLDILGG